MKIEKIRYSVLGFLIAIFAFLVISIFGLNERLSIRHLPIFVLIALSASFFMLGIVQVIMTIKIKEPKIKKIFFILSGASAAMIPVFAILHNVVYGLFFAGKQGDEAVFFILAVLVCPILFAASALGAVICEIIGYRKFQPRINANLR